MELSENQSALILESDENGEISVNVASADENSLTDAICQAIALKLTGDEQFQADLMEMIEQATEE